MRKKPVYRRVVYMGTKFSTTTSIYSYMPRYTFERLNYVVIYTVSLKLLNFSVVFTAPANCVEQRAQSCV